MRYSLPAQPDSSVRCCPRVDRCRASRDGLARPDKSAPITSTSGADVHRGSLADLESLRSAAAACGGVITGFTHDFSKFAESSEIDKRASEAKFRALFETKFLRVLDQTWSCKPLFVLSIFAKVKS
jgi:hypothetical protein